MRWFFHFLPVADGPPSNWTGQSAPQKDEPNFDQVHFVPSGEDLIEKGDVLVLVGKTKNLNQFMEF